MVLAETVKQEHHPFPSLSRDWRAVGKDGDGPFQGQVFGWWAGIQMHGTPLS